MRRLPIYFLIDISESMVGEPISQVDEGLATIIQALKTDPNALETVWVSIIVFAGQARTIVPLQELVNFYPPKFPIGSGTSLSRGLGHLMFELRKSIVKTTLDRKGDWKPIIFLLTDGVPTDDAHAAISEWKQHWQRSANMIAISVGNETDTHILGQLTEIVLSFKNTDTATYKQFFKWVTDSIKTSSQSVENNASGFELARLDSDKITKIDLTKTKPSRQQVDSNYVVISAKCQNTSRPYLMKFKRSVSPSGIMDFETLSYNLVGAYQVDKAYYELSDESGITQSINSDELVGCPACPCCSNPIGFAVCGCDKVHCISGSGSSTCPWCNSTSVYGSGEGFDINRTQG